MHLQNLVVVETFAGPEAIALGTCGVCGHSGWQSWDIGLVKLAENQWEHDEEPRCECPVCGLHEVSVDLRAAFPDLSGQAPRA